MQGHDKQPLDASRNRVMSGLTTPHRAPATGRSPAPSTRPSGCVHFCRCRYASLQLRPLLRTAWRRPPWAAAVEPAILASLGRGTIMTACKPLILPQPCSLPTARPRVPCALIRLLVRTTRCYIRQPGWILHFLPSPAVLFSTVLLHPPAGELLTSLPLPLKSADKPAIHHACRRRARGAHVQRNLVHGEASLG